MRTEHLGSRGEVTALEERTPVVSLEERRLLVRHLDGDDQAFSQLVRAFRAPIYGYLYRSGVKEDARDDLFQEIFLKVHGAAKSYAPERALAPWMFTIVANTVRSHFRRQKLEALIFSETPAADTNPRSEAPSAEQVTELKETAAVLEEAIRKLPFAQREVLLLASVQGLSLKDVSEALDLSLGNTKTLLHRARAAVASELARRNLRVQREAAR